MFPVALFIMAKIWKKPKCPSGFPGGSDAKESTCNAGDLSLIPEFGKLPWRRAWQPTPVFLPGECLLAEEPGVLQSIGSQRIRHKKATKHSILSAHQSVNEWVKKIQYMFIHIYIHIHIYIQTHTCICTHIYNGQYIMHSHKKRR